MGPLFILIGIIVLIYVFYVHIKNNDKQYKLFRSHSKSIAAIRTPVEFLSKRDELNGLMENKLFMKQRDGEYFYTLDDMMDARFHAILKDVADIAKIADKFKRAANRPSRKPTPRPGK